jgi:hypothetical protein
MGEFNLKQPDRCQQLLVNFVSEEMSGKLVPSRPHLRLAQLAGGFALPRQSCSSLCSGSSQHVSDIVTDRLTDARGSLCIVLQDDVINELKLSNGPQQPAVQALT